MSDGRPGRGTDELVVERRGSVLVLRLNRPEVRNALSWSMIGGIGDAVAEAESDPQIRALVITGTGDRSFCSGMDLRSFADGGATLDEQGDGYLRLVAGQVEVPVIGAANATRGGRRLRAAHGLRRGGGLVGGVLRAARGQARPVRRQRGHARGQAVAVGRGPGGGPHR